MSFEDYMSLVGARLPSNGRSTGLGNTTVSQAKVCQVSFLETGLSGAPLCPGGADRAVTARATRFLCRLVWHSEFVAAPRSRTSRSSWSLHMLTGVMKAAAHMSSHATDSPATSAPAVSVL